MNFPLKLILFILVYFITNSNGNRSLFNYSLDTVIKDLSPDYLAKIETYVYLDPNEATTTFIICIATLSTEENGRQIYIEKRKFVAGETGSSGPERIAIANQFNNTKRYKDIDIVHGPSDCIFGAISTENLMYIGTGASPFTPTEPIFVADRIELVGLPNEPIYSWLQYYTYTVVDRPELRTFDVDHSMDAIMTPDGGFMSAMSGTPTGSQIPVQLFGNGTDNSFLFDVAAVNPSVVIIKGGIVVVCGEDAYSSRGIVCGLYPLLSSALNVRPNNATVRYHRPIVSMLNATSDSVCMASVITDIYNNTFVEIAVIIVFGEIQTSTTRAGGYQIHATAKNDYIFSVYATPTACKLDVLYFGENPPVIPTPPDPPIAAPVSSPTSSSPIVSPVTLTPVTQPLSSDIPQPKERNSASNLLTPEQLGAAIGVPVVVSILGAGLLVLLLMLRKRRKAKKNKSSDEWSLAASNGDVLAERATKQTDNGGDHQSVALVRT